MPSRMDIGERLMKYSIPEPNSGCWLWLASISNNGYGQITSGYVLDGDRRTRWAHRVSYETFVGRIPEGLDLDHLCRVRSCINPQHLEPVTRSENSLRGIGWTTGGAEWNRRKTHCHKGHPYSGSNLYICPTRGTRACKICQRDNVRRNRARVRSNFVSTLRCE
jgi:hypothetical protein